MSMQIIIPIAAVITLALVAATSLLLRSFFTSNPYKDDASPVPDVCWRDYRPLERLLDPSDFQFMRSRGISEFRIRKLRAERRRIYRLCLRSLAYDFHVIHECVNMLLIESGVDRPELAAELARQQLTFYRNLFQAEFRLTLHACGFNRMPVIDLLQPLEVLQSHLRQLEVVGAAA